MSFWNIMNTAAWTLSGIIGVWLVYDFVKAEKRIRDDKNENQWN